MELIVKFTPKKAHSSKIIAEDLTDNKDFKEFVRENINKSITVSLKLSQRIPEKEQMYSYYHKVILSIAMQVFTNDGWESVDKVKADYLLKAECGKGLMYNAKTNTEEVYLLDKSRMNKDRLKKFITDCIVFLEVEKGCKVPDSSSYLMELRSGMSGFKSVK